MRSGALAIGDDNLPGAIVHRVAGEGAGGGTPTETSGVSKTIKGPLVTEVCGISTHRSGIHRDTFIALRLIKIFKIEDGC